jgi:carbonyl reductase 1
LPVIRQDGRLVNMTSSAGSLGKFSPALATRFRNAKTVDDITALMKEFTSAVAAGNEAKEGWPSAAYATSKAGATGATMVIGREEAMKDKGILVNACCPGWVKVSSNIL